MWSSLSKSDRAIYEEFAKRDKKRYDKEMKDFLDNGGNVSKLSEVESRRPKKCLSAYMIFVRETRSKVQKENKNMHVLEIMKQVGKQWQGLNATDRKVYQDKADEDKIRYRKELKEFEKEVDKLELKKSIKTVSRPRKKKATSETKSRKRAARDSTKDPNKPVKARSAYIIF